MRRMLAAVVIVSFAALAGAADDEKYTSKEGKFTIEFPKGTKPVLKTDKAGGGIDMKQATVEDKVNDRAFIVMYMDLPEAAKNVPPKAILDGAEKGAVDNSKGKLVESKDIEFSKEKFPGREILVEKEGNKIKTWVIIAGTRVYVLAVGGKKDFAIEKDGAAFLKSFEITK